MVHTRIRVHIWTIFYSERIIYPCSFFSSLTSVDGGALAPRGAQITPGLSAACQQLETLSQKVFLAKTNLLWWHLTKVPLSSELYCEVGCYIRALFYTSFLLSDKMKENCHYPTLVSHIYTLRLLHPVSAMAGCIFKDQNPRCPGS